MNEFRIGFSNTPPCPSGFVPILIVNSLNCLGLMPSDALHASAKQWSYPRYFLESFMIDIALFAYDIPTDFTSSNGVLDKSACIHSLNSGDFSIRVTLSSRLTVLDKKKANWSISWIL